jgi:hypothetical protein
MLARVNTWSFLPSRVDYGYEPGGRLKHENHVDNALAIVPTYIGVTEIKTIAQPRRQLKKN